MIIRMEKGRITDEETNKKGYGVDFTGGCHCRNPLSFADERAGEVTVI